MHRSLRQPFSKLLFPLTASAANVAIFQAAPLLASVAMFAAFTLLADGDLTPDVAFPALAWVNVSVASAFHESLPAGLLLHSFTLKPQ